MTNGDPYFQQLLVIAAFLGGISFTALVLVLGQFAGYENAFGAFGGGLVGEVLIDVLITLIAGVSASFVFATWLALPLASSRESGQEERGNLAVKFYVVGNIGFLLMLPLSLFAYSKLAALVLGIIELVFLWFSTKHG